MKVIAWASLPWLLMLAVWGVVEVATHLSGRGLSVAFVAALSALFGAGAYFERRKAR